MQPKANLLARGVGFIKWYTTLGSDFKPSTLLQLARSNIALLRTVLYAASSFAFLLASFLLALFIYACYYSFFIPVLHISAPLYFDFAYVSHAQCLATILSSPSWQV
jgi:hypothetical protein